VTIPRDFKRRAAALRESLDYLKSKGRVVDFTIMPSRHYDVQWTHPERWFNTFSELEAVVADEVTNMWLLESLIGHLVVDAQWSDGAVTLTLETGQSVTVGGCSCCCYEDDDGRG
jgi:hypothetical protein